MNGARYQTTDYTFMTLMPYPLSHISIVITIYKYFPSVFGASLIFHTFEYLNYY